MLYRKIQPYIESYLKSDSNKVLIIDGARQIGKTFIIRHVGQQLFENYIELNFAEDYNGPRLFEQVLHRQGLLFSGQHDRRRENGREEKHADFP